MVYVATLIQQMLCGLYQPSAYSIIPMLVQNDNEDLQRATTLQGVGWSVMQAFGAALSGVVVDAVGIRLCFVLDCATFLISAMLMWSVRGDYRAVPEKKDAGSGKWDDSSVQETSSESEYSDLDASLESMSDFDTTTSSDEFDHDTTFMAGVRYLISSDFCSLVLLKGCYGLVWGATDILTVVLSETPMGTGIGSDIKLGIMFAFVGVGALVGPLITEPFVNVEKPASLQLSCVLAFCATALGNFGWCSKSASFWVLGVFAMIRQAGASVIWIHSSLMLQKFASTQMMGRVLAMDEAIALATEALSAYVSGLSIDRYGLSFYQVSFGLAIISVAFTLFWLVYHLSGRGANKYEYQTRREEEDDSVELGLGRWKGEE